MKKIIFLSIIIGLLSYHRCNAQNLVPNPGFENLLSPVTIEGQIVLASPWFTPGGGTPDLFNSVYAGPPANPCDAVGVPVNFGGYAPAASGNGYAGISIDAINGFYEYIEIELSIALQAGELYKVEMDVLRADSSQYACNRFGVLLSNNSWAQTGSALIGVTPQFENSTLVIDTANWTHLTFSPAVYQAAGGESFITIGVFRAIGNPLFNFDDQGNQNPGCGNANGRAYYYIDNVIVRPLNELVTITTSDTVLCPGDSTLLTANANVPVWWSDEFNPSDTISHAFDLSVSPLTTTTYYLNGQTLIDTITIYVVNPPAFDLGPDTTFCEGDTVALNAFTPDGIFYTWSNGDTSAITAVSDTGTYWVTVNNLGCAVSDTIRYQPLLPNPPVDLGLDSTYCFFDNDTLYLDAGNNAISYSWFPFGDTTQVIKILIPAFYEVTVTRVNGCKRRAGFEVLEICEPKFFVPAAFTPDGDGLNDIFLPVINNVTQYSLQVYTREGKLIFSSGNPKIGWDGTFNGKEVPSGVYAFRLFYGGFDSDGEKRKGRLLNTVTLIR